jgi:hypothetical protein
MTRKYDFVTKLMNGNTEASAKTRWWPRHSQSMTRYLTVFEKGTVAAQKSVRDTMTMAANEWEMSICRPHPPALMIEHAGLEVAFIDSAMRKDIVSMERLGSRLTTNAKAQTEFYASRVKEFPATRWYGLLMDHIRMFIESTRYHMAGDQKLFMDCEARRQVNTLALAEVTTEWL